MLPASNAVFSHSKNLPALVEMSFHKDLALGNQFEKKFSELIEYDTCEFSNGRFKEWDIHIQHNNEDIFFEVKCDRRSQTTGNIAIEYEYKSKPSGINATTADYWAYFIYGKPIYYLIPTEALREAIGKNRYKCTVRGGDGYHSAMYLFPITEFESFKESIPE